ncbi:hypothetical protein BGZ61DRAFT_469995 [Ilyonectria robusta]|uniref:uncharacterized protein n=1 Tax=Ilyonectria robusta TaxID=1079257 RepID=UPI001E8ED100|nr:uncharacterized protein BGZ61DRAFT_469995 [Ilyonectria robusta]KAH8646458.1 hypothetical protein BGZ61DRAFT_469995 [Ilyonectria robusta]
MDMILTDSNVISPPDSMNVPEHELRSPQWTRSSTPNMSHIQIVWAQFPRFCGTEHDITPRVHLCPLQNNARDPGDIMGGRHRSVIGYNCCSEIAPGTQTALFGARKEKVEATMPYISLNTGLQSTSQEVTGGEERLRADDWAFIIHFRCMGEATGPQIRPELHGIPWPSD